MIELFLAFFKIGLFTFGGGYAMIPLISQEVAAHGWLTAEQLVDFVAVSESTPGPFAVNIATFVGMRVHGVAGAALATLGVVLPSFLIILLVARFFRRFRQSFAVRGVLFGLKPAVVGLIGAAAVSVAAASLFPGGWQTAVLARPAFWVFAGIFAVSAVLIFRQKWHPIAVIGLSAALGVACGYALNL